MASLWRFAKSQHEKEDTALRLKWIIYRSSLQQHESAMRLHNIGLNV